MVCALGWWAAARETNKDTDGRWPIEGGSTLRAVGIIAQTENHALYGDLGIRSLAVCGVLRCADGILIGRRPPAAVYQPGLWQLCPAGSVDASAVDTDGRIDARGQLLTEIREELGLPPETIGPITPLCIVEHPGAHVCDFGLMADVPLNAAVVMTAHREHGNGEYDPLRIVPVQDLPFFIMNATGTIVPPAPIFLMKAGLLPRYVASGKLTASNANTIPTVQTK